MARYATYDIGRQSGLKVSARDVTGIEWSPPKRTFDVCGAPQPDEGARLRGGVANWLSERK
jgi:hypothetical protein